MALAIDSFETGHSISAGGHRAAGTLTLTYSFTNTAGNLLVVGVVATENNTGTPVPAISSVTYNSVTMHALTPVSWATNNNSTLNIFYLGSPTDVVATGANNIVITCTGDSASNFAVLAGAMSFSGAADTLSGAVSATDGGATGTHAQAGSLTTASGNYIFAVGGWGSGVAATSVDQTAAFGLAGSGNSGGDDICGCYALSSGAAINMGFSWATADNWGIMAVPVTAAATGALSIPSAADSAATAELSVVGGTLTTGQLEIHYSGGASNTNPDSSLGSAISNTAATNSAADNVWDDINAGDSGGTLTQYTCLYVKNPSVSRTWQQVVLWIDGVPSQGQAAIGLDGAAVGSTAASTTADRHTAPSPAITWHDTTDGTPPTSKANGLSIGDIPPGSFKAIWQRRIIPSGRTTASDQISIRAEGLTL